MTREQAIAEYVYAEPVPSDAMVLQMGHWVTTSTGKTYRITVVIEDIHNAAEAANPSPPAKQAHKG